MYIKIKTNKMYFENFRTKQSEIAENILKSYSSQSLDDLNLENDLEKGRKAAVVGEVREFGGKKYAKTSTGWRPINEKHSKEKDNDVDNKYEEVGEDHKHKVGDKVKVHNRLTTDPYNKRGHEGTVVAVDPDDPNHVHVKFPGASNQVGVYEHNALMKESKDNKSDSKNFRITRAMFENVRDQLKDTHNPSDKNISNAMRIYAQKLGNTYTESEYNEMLDEYKEISNKNSVK